VDLSAYRYTDSITVDRAPEDVWAVITDVTRIGEMSPVCTAAEYDDPATGAVPGARYDYREPTPAQIEQVTRIKAICDRYGVPLAAAALQFPLAHPAVASVIPGPASPAQVQSNVQAVRHPIPADLWRDLKAVGLLRENAPTPAGEMVHAS